MKTTSERPLRDLALRAKITCQVFVLLVIVSTCLRSFIVSEFWFEFFKDTLRGVKQLVIYYQGIYQCRFAYLIDLELCSLCPVEGACPLDPLPKPKRPSLLSLGKVETGESRRSGVLRKKVLLLSINSDSELQK